MFQEDAYTILKKLGLKENEADVYVACLRSKGGLQVQEIVNGTGIKRSTVNLVLERLQEKGFVTYHLEGSRKVFTAESPEHLLYALEGTVSDFKGIIPLLREETTSGSASRVRFFEGKEGVEKIYSDSLLTLKMERDPRKELLAISSGKDVFKVMPGHQKQFIDKRVKEQIPIRWIAPESEEDKAFVGGADAAFRQMRFFDSKKYPFEIEVDVYGNKVAMTNLDERDPKGFIIEDKGLAGSFRSLFNLIWDSLPDSN